jgi:hypothetical protein
MAAKRKTKKKLNKTAAKSGRRVMKMARTKLAKKPKKKLRKKKPALKKGVVKTKALGKKSAAARTVGAARKRASGANQSLDREAFAPQGLGSGSAGQSGDLQGLSNLESADSESVDELIEEGNAFEADVVAGVESAGDEKEVRTHEVPEDDVPGEYLDKE